MKKKIITLAGATMMLLAGCANINQATQKMLKQNLRVRKWYNQRRINCQISIIVH